MNHFLINTSKGLLLCLFFSLIAHTVAQAQSYKLYTKTATMVPMRDGIKLYTTIYTPIGAKEKLPILIKRTPYGAKERDTVDMTAIPYESALAKDGYIFVYQDIRGKFKSEGKMEMNKPLYHLTNPNATDESTDCHDTVDWLVKNVENNNGKAGIRGISYPGWTALVAVVDPHPALKASSEQASPADMYLGDDFHHNGAFRLSYGLEYAYLFENDPTKNSSFPFPQFDLYDWYLNLGPLKNVNEKYLHGRLPTWERFINHPDYDALWKEQSAFTYMSEPEIPILHVGGYYDQEDLNGPQALYLHMEKKDKSNRNYLLMGPWNHGGWGRMDGDSLGRINFGSKTAVHFREKEKQWFDFWLKDEGDGNFEEAHFFQTGSNQWKSYDSWPPKDIEIKKLYIGPNNTNSFLKPKVAEGFTSYTSDPARPVPYRTLPIEATYGKGSRWRSWQVEDQRFVYTRPDVVSFTGEVLTEDVTVTGNIITRLFASTSGTDSDWVVKLIDVYPNFDEENILMSNYQFPVAMEVFRGRYRESFEKPKALTPNKPEEYVIDLHNIDHTFKKGHRIMIQVQSSWFPVIDRNPQKFVPSIFEATEEDFIKAEQRIYFSAKYPTHIELPVKK
mgnify:CR=1 FL=1